MNCNLKNYLLNFIVHYHQANLTILSMMLIILIVMNDVYSIFLLLFSYFLKRLNSHYFILGTTLCTIKLPFLPLRINNGRNQPNYN
jgi:hypothetical protein